MQINNTYPQQNFNGAFRFKPNEIKARTEVPQLFTQGRQVFRDILEKGDEVIVVRDNFDKRIGKYIAENNVREVEYYPTINTKCGLDSEEPQGLRNLLKDKSTRIITDMNEMFATIKQQKKTPKIPQPPKPLEINPLAEVQKVSNSLRLNLEKPKISIDKNFIKVRDDVKKRTIEIIVRDSGHQYVHVKPDAKWESSTRCIINGKGNIVKSFEKPDDIHKFLVKFSQMKKGEI